MQDQQDRQAPETTVTVKCTGRVRTRVGDSRFEYSFAGETLRAFLGTFFDDYDVSDMLIAETEAEASTDGWASGPAELPGENYAKNRNSISMVGPRRSGHLIGTTGLPVQMGYDRRSPSQFGPSPRLQGATGRVLNLLSYLGGYIFSYLGL